MPKKLNLNDLQVKSFQTDVTSKGGGFTDDGKCIKLSIHPIYCRPKTVLGKDCESWFTESPDCWAEPF